MPVAAAWAACGRLPRSQWRVRAGFAPASLSTDLVGAHAIPGLGMTVNLTRIYTRLGDGGETHLGDMSRVPKTHPRIEAYGTVDELNAQLGLALTVPGLPDRHAEWLRRVQNDLFDVGADISVPEGGRGEAGDRAARRGQGERLRVVPEQTVWLEQACDE